MWYDRSVHIALGSLEEGHSAQSRGSRNFWCSDQSVPWMSPSILYILLHFNWRSVNKPKILKFFPCICFTLRSVKVTEKDGGVSWIIIRCSFIVAFSFTPLSKSFQLYRDAEEYTCIELLYLGSGAKRRKPCGFTQDFGLDGAILSASFCFKSLVLTFFF